MATKVVMYKAKDDSLHATPALADAQNLKIRTEPLIEAFVNSLTEASPGMTNDDTTTGAGGLRIDLIDLPAFLLAHSDQLRTALNEATIVRKPRKAKAGDEAPKTPRTRKPKVVAAAAAPTGTPAPSPAPVVKVLGDVSAQGKAEVAAADPLDDVLASLDD